MQNWRSPWWVLLTGVFPTGALLALGAQIFYILAPQLENPSKVLWYLMGSGLGILLLGQLTYFFNLQFKGGQSSIYFHAGIYLLTCAWLYAYLQTSETLIPADTPPWMVGNEAFVYPFSFLMPNLAFSLYTVIAHLTNFEKNPKPLENLMGAIGIAILAYAAINAVFIGEIDHRYLEHIAIVMMGSLATLFFFFLGRALYIYAHRPWSGWGQTELLLRGVLGIAFPIWGLMLNNNGWGFIPDKIFGDFSSPWFYLLAAINGVLYTLPNYPQPVYRLILFLLRSLCFSFIVYFALVFLPYMPLAIPAIFIIGFGFLMLTPIILLILQSGTWVKDLQYLQTYFPKTRVLLGGILGGLVLPLSLYLSALSDRATLHRALDYVYAPNLANPGVFELAEWRLQRVLHQIDQNKKRQSWEPGNKTVPYLSHFYNSIVLDNLNLSDRKLNKLEAIFLGKSLRYFPEGIEPHSLLQIKNARVDSKWDAIDQSWRSTLHLEIENTYSTLEEYRSIFSLPHGALIQDYYLYVGKEKVKGQLAEKKTATWIYEQIVNNSRRDPGLLSYLDPQTLSLRVYPFQAKELRKTGFTVIHKEAFSLKMDGHNLVFGDTTHNQQFSAPIILGNGQVAYLPSALSETLPKVQLAPHYHFILDCSVKSKKHLEAQISDLEAWLGSQKYTPEQVHFHLTNREVLTLSNNTNWQAALRQHPKVGGFFAERAFEQILYEYATKPLKHYPVMILVGKNLPVMPELSPRLAHAVYNGTHYYRLDKGSIESNSFLGKTESLEFPSASISAMAYPNTQNPIAYVPAAGLVRLPKYAPNAALKKNTWESAALFQAEWQYQEAHPEGAESAWLSLVKKSFETNLLCPETAYLVLENESQRRFLKIKQQQVLQGKKALDVGEEPERMSEPGFWILLLGMLALLLWRFKMLP